MSSFAQIFTSLFLAAMLFSPAVAQKKSFKTELSSVKAESVANFDHPWGVAFVDADQAVVTERGGGLYLVALKTGEKIAITNPPKAYIGGQGGLLDVALHPDFKQNGLVYFSHAYQDSEGTGTAITRARLQGHTQSKPELVDRQILFQSATSPADFHFGSRLAFAPDGTLFVTIGDHGQRKRAQDQSQAAGSVIRLNDDGSIPTDNPDFHNGLPGLWSIGHRNQQGATIHPKTGKLWTVEHGARGGDEINQPQKGKNYGWPEISYGRHYYGGKIGRGTQAPGLEQPIYYWDPSIAPSGLTFYYGTQFPAWQDDLFVGALKDEMLVRLTIKDNKIVAEERMFQEQFGRIRDVRQGPNGALWLLTDESNGQLIRITPAN